MIIVTGANGFIGSAIIWELNRANLSNIIAVDTVSLTQRPEPLKNKKYSRFLLKDQILNRLLKKFLIIIHFLFLLMQILEAINCCLSEQIGYRVARIVAIGSMSG